jgi:hypothetical protein
MQRRGVITLLAWSATWPLAVRAQQKSKIGGPNWWGDDGSAGAPIIAAGPQNLHALNINSPGTNPFGATYTSRPEHKVPSVDYPVGIPDSAFPLKDPFPSGAVAPALAALGVSQGGANWLQTGLPGVVIDGWDFSLHGGFTLFITKNDVTVQHCKFQVGTLGGPCASDMTHQ